MRIRNKPWAKEELTVSKFYVQLPEKYKGRWKEFFNNSENPIHLELGCGKGFFVKKVAKQQADQIINDAKEIAKQQAIELENEIMAKRKELVDVKKQFDIYKAKMESLLISQLELLKDVNKED